MCPWVNNVNPGRFRVCGFRWRAQDPGHAYPFGMRSSDELRFVIDFEVTDLDTFRKAVADAVEVSRGEPGTLLYDWYIDEEAGHARLYEAYESADAIQVHAEGKVFSEIGPALFASSKITHIDAYGDPEVQKVAEMLGPIKLWGKPFESLGR